MPILTEDELLNRLRDKCKNREQKKFAELHDISPQYLSDVLARRRSMGPAILKALRATPIPSMFVVEDRKWAKKDTRLLKNAYDGVRFEDVE